MKKTILILLASLALMGVAQAKPAPATQTIQWNISTDKSGHLDHRYIDLVYMAKGKIVGFQPHIGARPNERWFGLSNSGGVAQYFVSPGGSPLGPDISTVIASSTGCAPGCVKVEDNGAVDVTLVGGSISFSLPFSGLSDQQAGTTGASIGLMGYTGVDNCGSGSSPCFDRLQSSSGALNVSVQQGTSTIGGVNSIPKYQTYGAKTPLVSQADFAVNNASCTAVVDPASYTGGAPNTGHYCWNFLVGPGTIYEITYQSLSNMNTLVVGTTVQCYDNATTNTGAIVWEAMAGAGGWRPFVAPYGRPVVNGLTCIANHAFGVAANDSLEVILKK
jgi:hypothetical protein